MCGGEAKERKMKDISGAKVFLVNNFISFRDVYVKLYFSISLHVFVQYIGTTKGFKRKLLKLKV